MKEIKEIDHIIANDLDENAVKAIERNMTFNGVDKNRYSTTQEDARFLLYSIANGKRKRISDNIHDPITIIDLDPYGSAAPFLDGAAEAISSGGLLCITCTDLAVLCGNYSETCFSKYGAMTPKGSDYCHEMALRILLGSLSKKAAEHKKKITPLISFYADFYIRVFVRVENSKGDIKLIPSKTGWIFQCTQCNSFHTQRFGKIVETKSSFKTTLADGPVVDRLCDQCNSIFKIGGPIWLDPIVDPDFLNRTILELEKEETIELYGTRVRMLSVLKNIQQELHDVPLFYNLSKLCNTLRLKTPKLDIIRSAIVNHGYKVTLSHTDPNSLKTNAPNNVIWDIMRCYNKQLAPVKMESLPPGSAAFKILSKEPSFDANFELCESALVQRRMDGKRVKRFIPNPEKNWGPGMKAGRKRYVLQLQVFLSNHVFRDSDGMMQDVLADRRKTNQGKRTNKDKRMVSH